MIFIYSFCFRVYNVIWVIDIKKFIIFFVIVIFFLVISFDFDSDSSYYYPLEEHSVISSHFGYRELYGSLNFHTGIDFAYPKGTEVHSFCFGIIKYASFLNGYGNCIIIQHENGYRSLYGHLDENFIVSVGDTILANEVIGYIGPLFLSNGMRNGNSTGPHLHFELYNEKGDLIDPLSLKYVN